MARPRSRPPLCGFRFLGGAELQIQLGHLNERVPKVLFQGRIAIVLKVLHGEQVSHVVEEEPPEGATFLLYRPACAREDEGARGAGLQCLVDGTLLLVPHLKVEVASTSMVFGGGIMVASSSRLHVVQKSTAEDFYEPGYTLFNSDIRTHVERGGSAEEHFRQHGVNEARFQFTEAFVRLLEGDKRRARFERYRDALGLTNDSHRFIDREGSFPVSVSNQHYSRDDYAAGESANDSYGPFERDIEENPSGLFMDLGCGLRKVIYENCIYVEVYPSMTADVVVGTECEYPFPDNTFDGIGCFSVLEHTKNPWKVAQEIHRMLKPSGRCYIDWPFLAPVHGYPSHYFNATREGLIRAFSEGFDLVRVQTEDSQGPDYAALWFFKSMMAQLPDDVRADISGITLGELVQTMPQDVFWKRILGALPASAIEELAAGNTLIATKK